MKHILKCEQDYFQASWEGNKNFELRKNDRGFQKGDIIILKELERGKITKTGREIECLVTYVLSHEALKEGWVCLSTSRIEKSEGNK